MWTYDLAREQSPTLETLRWLCENTLEAGYTHLGLYLEHRFAYPSTSWAHGVDCLTPDLVRQIIAEFPKLEIVPFVNLLGHMEGFLYTEQGKKYAEDRFKGLQACPLSPGFKEFAFGLLKDVLDVFPSQMVHLGGDETNLLGHSELCKAKVEAENAKGRDGKAVLYAEHFKELVEYVVSQGRTPALWGDMFIEHPEALEIVPSDAILFDWQYFNGPAETAAKMRKTHRVVVCPALHTYNSVWMHLRESEQNVRDHVAAVEQVDAEGVCVTTWEQGLMGNYEALMPAIVAAGKILNGSQETFLDSYGHESEAHRRWAELMAHDLIDLGGAFGFSRIRSSLKCRLLLQGNPFLAWKHHAAEFSGDNGLKALEVVELALAAAPSAAYRSVSQFVKAGIEFVRYAEQARQAYAEGLPGVATSCLAPCRQVFEDLERMAQSNHLRCGGSRADIERCRVARRFVEVVIGRIKEYGDGSLGYLPSFEHLTHPNFMPHDQACWWRINQWSRE